MNIPLNKINIICGHYGSGKTNFSINLAMNTAKHSRVTLVDLDIVNPYFRSGDYKEMLKDNGVKVIAPQFVNSNLDIPSLPAEMYSIFSDKESVIIIDLGGDDAGATALGRFSKQIIESGDYALYYVVNCFRALTTKVDEAAQILSEIEKTSHLKATGVINNSHLQNFTTEKEILKGYDFAKKTADRLSLPLVATTCPKSISHLIKDVKNLYEVNIIVKTPFSE